MYDGLFDILVYDFYCFVWCFWFWDKDELFFGFDCDSKWIVWIDSGYELFDYGGFQGEIGVFCDKGSIYDEGFKVQVLKEIIRGMLNRVDQVLVFVCWMVMMLLFVVYQLLLIKMIVLGWCSIDWRMGYRMSCLQQISGVIFWFVILMIGLVKRLEWVLLVFFVYCFYGCYIEIGIGMCL